MGDLKRDLKVDLKVDPSANRRPDHQEIYSMPYKCLSQGTIRLRKDKAALGEGKRGVSSVFDGHQSVAWTEYLGRILNVFRLRGATRK